MDARASQIAAAYPRALGFADVLVSVSDKLGIDPAWLANVINFESGFRTDIQNRYTKATGLIQFMPSTASRLGTSVDALKGMTGTQQMRYVEAYFRPYAGRLKSQADVYAAVFYPVAIGKGLGYTFSAAVTKVNPGIRTMGDYVNMASKRAKLTSLAQSGTTLVQSEARSVVTTVQQDAGKVALGVMLVGLGLGGFWLWRVRAAQLARRSNPRKRERGREWSDEELREEARELAKIYNRMLAGEHDLMPEWQRRDAARTRAQLRRGDRQTYAPEWSVPDEDDD